MRRRGRPPLPRGVWSIDDLSIEAPSEAVLDTSFVVEAFIVSQPLHESCLAYLLRLVEAETNIVFNHLLEIELYEATFQLALKERPPRIGSDFATTGEHGREPTGSSRTSLRRGRRFLNTSTTRGSNSPMSKAWSLT